MATHDARGRAGHVGQDGVEQPAVPPAIHVDAVGDLDFGLQSEPLQIVLDALRAAGVDVERQQIKIGRFEQMRRLATRRGAGIEHARAVRRRQQFRRTLRTGILYRD